MWVEVGKYGWVWVGVEGVEIGIMLGSGWVWGVWKVVGGWNRGVETKERREKTIKHTNMPKILFALSHLSVMVFSCSSLRYFIYNLFKLNPQPVCVIYPQPVSNVYLLMSVGGWKTGGQGWGWGVATYEWAVG